LFLEIKVEDASRGDQQILQPLNQTVSNMVNQTAEQQAIDEQL
jgi:hypothetical protein